MCFLCFLRPVPWPRKLITCTTRLLAREVEVLDVDDVLAIAIHAGMSTDELGMVDLAYAPPFSGVWDAVQIAANAAK